MATILEFPRATPLNVAVDLLDDILLPNFEVDHLRDHPDSADLYFGGWVYTTSYIRALESVATPEQLQEAHEYAESEAIEDAARRLNDDHVDGENLDRTPDDFLRVWREYCTPPPVR